MWISSSSNSGVGVVFVLVVILIALSPAKEVGYSVVSINFS